jgi:membrane associated rhomboid family serine protease
MIPISDDNPVRLAPILNYFFIAACVVVFGWQISLTELDLEQSIRGFAFVPVSLFQGGAALSLDTSAWAWMTLATSMFLHGGWMHLGGNMLYLWIFGNNIEDAMGHFRYLIFYLSCGIGAALGQAVSNPQSDIPMIGASGAISGVLAAYLLIFPRARVTVIVPLGVLLYPLKISAFYVIGFWFLIQLFQAGFADPNAAGVAWWAHIGGFAAGLVLAPLLSQFPLFGRHRSGPWG